MILYEVMNFCNLGDQSQFETSNLNSHWINTNNTLLLGFCCLIMSSWIISKYVIIQFLKLDVTKILL